MVLSVTFFRTMDNNLAMYRGWEPSCDVSWVEILAAGDKYFDFSKRSSNSITNIFNLISVEIGSLGLIFVL